ncbi:acetoacetate decarboxylase family protein [Methylocella sp. CPCC 101449]|uniref:acetoacetate decarboxylase family protein n=1 Tax=Methylocella sp. CPCC 101449 TaxID=2987531 RepID=UPI00288F0425|nr:acetoacetate decarboxylase family protein [Methylocella sp. CPCC 101449]MDT2024584.1 acetoacetate decarboxylase family protein [Methylocella sp. CPCC 101449]
MNERVNQIAARLRYRMPVVFGPTVGPRQGPNGEMYDYSEAPRTTATVSFLTTQDALSKLLPPHCMLDGEPIVTVEHAELRELQWLAGRSYSMLGIKFPVLYRGPTEAARGSFLAVLWENRVDPILSGREELGFAKLHCQLPAPRSLNGTRTYSAIWDEHPFMRLALSDLADAAPPPSTARDGTLHHRFFPQVGGISAAIDEIVLTPSGGAKVQYDRFQRGSGRVEFVRSTWEELPTMFHIINALADLPIIAYRGATLAETRGAKDLSDQRVLR